MSGFGDYPLGAANDKMAPWNREDEKQMCCPICGSEDIETEYYTVNGRPREDAFCQDCGESWTI